MSDSTEHATTRADFRARLLLHGIATVEATYSGSGDDGQFDELDFHAPKSGHGKAFAMKLGATLSQAEHAEIPDNDDIEALLNTFLEEEHSGWQNDEGGNGVFIWDLQLDIINWTHRTAYISYEEDTYTR